jgi:hypothetical protein
VGPDLRPTFLVLSREQRYDVHHKDTAPALNVRLQHWTPYTRGLGHTMVCEGFCTCKDI